MVWEHIPKDEVALMQGVWAIEEARFLQKEQAKKDPPPKPKEESKAEEEENEDPYDLWGYG